MDKIIPDGEYKNKKVREFLYSKQMEAESNDSNSEYTPYQLMLRLEASWKNTHGIFNPKEPFDCLREDAYNPHKTRTLAEMLNKDYAAEDVAKLRGENLPLRYLQPTFLKA